MVKNDLFYNHLKENPHNKTIIAQFENYSKTNFMKELSSMPMLSCELKRELYQKVKPVIKNKIRK